MRAISMFLTVLACFSHAGTGRAEEPDADQPKVRAMPPFISPSGKPYRSAPGEPYAKAKWFDSIDTDADQTLTLAEFQAEADGFYTEMDADQDGRITSIEIAHYEQVVAPEVQAGYLPPGVRRTRPPSGMPTPGGPGGGPPSGAGGGPSQAMMKELARMPQGAARFAILGMPQPLASADANMNGSVTRQEMLEAAATRFGWLDAMGDRNGKIVWDELPKAPIESMMRLPSRGSQPKKKRVKHDDKAPVPGQRQPVP